MNKRRLIINSFLSIFLVSVLLIGSTYSIFTSQEIDENTNVYKTGNLEITYMDNSGVVLSDPVPKSDDESCWITPYRIIISNTGNVPYQFDCILTDTTSSADNTINYQYIKVQVGKQEIKTLNEFTNNVIADDITILAGESVVVEIRVWISDEVKNSELGKSFYAKLVIDGQAVINDSKVIDNSNLVCDRCYNAPNLDDSDVMTLAENVASTDTNNLIPVYYDDIEEVWKKADKTNKDNTWYDYNNKMWANAVIIGDSEKKSTYQAADVGTTILDEDITAFYVWIPRFKYRVWNITRKSLVVSSYAYDAYSNGIDIEWENGTKSTGNVKCSYNINAKEADTTLADVCVYKSTDTITTESNNTDYKDAWYTHPAFTFGNKEIEGFWIGKFETTGDENNPTILPDARSLMYQNVSAQFTTSKIFQSYLSSNIDAHMLTNLEWGAVSYLAHSIYGNCNRIVCNGVYINNSSDSYTGRSGGAAILTSIQTLTDIYGSAVTTETKRYNTTGYYTYKGYFIDYYGNITADKDISKIASTTGNITGVYDMSGGAPEHVMGSMVDENGEFYPSSVGSSWNGSDSLDKKYYTAYSYGTTNGDTMAFNRARLGDATAEVLSGYKSISTINAWIPPTRVTSAIGSYSRIVNGSSSWYVRGVNYSNTYTSNFGFQVHNGQAYNRTFRSALS